jgi:hypothetical protein
VGRGVYWYMHVCECFYDLVEAIEASEAAQV